MRKERKQVVVLGGGFAGFRVATDLPQDEFEVTIISPRNYFLFTPLLPSTTVGTIEFRSIIESLRTAREDLQYYQATCVAVDATTQSITCQSVKDATEFALPYDYLVIAVGAVSNTYNVPGVREHCHFLKDLSDARTIRQGILDCLERAATPGITQEERNRLLSFVVIGGGPTGVEFAAELHDFLTQDLTKWYPELAPKLTITLLEASQSILNSFDAKLRTYAAELFARQGIRVLFGSLVKQVDEGCAVLNDGREIPFGLAVWSTGIGATELVKSLNTEKDAIGRVLTDEYLQVPQFPNVYAIGDCACARNENVLATAQLAEQQGKYVADSLRHKLQNREIKPFEFRNMGMLAYIGGRKALADLPTLKGRGFLTWFFWRSVYLTKLVSLKNRVLVLFDWTKTSLFGRDISKF